MLFLSFSLRHSTEYYWRKIKDKLTRSFRRLFFPEPDTLALIGMASHHPSELDSVASDSVASSPRSDYPTHDIQPRVRFMCSFGGKILPRPHDNQLRYVGGDTRIVAVHRATTFSGLLLKLSKLSGTTNISVKYQLPNEDLDALISVTTDEDVENMMEEYDRLALSGIGLKTARLRLFLFPSDDGSRASSISSLLDGSSKRENWFFDAINGGGLERGRSEASSIVSEVPDYLFGLDNSDDIQALPRESKLKTRTALAENVSVSDPGSPAPAITSPFCSTSSGPSVPAIPDLPPVKTKPDKSIPPVEVKDNPPEGFADVIEPAVPQSGGYAGNPMWHYNPDSHYPGQPVHQIPVYYVPGPVPPGNMPVQSVPVRPQYVPQYPGPPGQIPVGFRHPGPGMGQVYGGAIRAVGPMEGYDMPMRVVSDGMNQQVYYGVRTTGMVQAYPPGMVVPAGEEFQGNGSDKKPGRVSTT